jgi:hypothetical protein
LASSEILLRIPLILLKVHQGSQVGAPVNVPGSELRARATEDRQRDERRLDLAPQRRRVLHCT